MTPRNLILSLEGEPSELPSRRVLRTLESAIRSGRLRPGEALPGTRALAEMLGVSRNTIIPVLQELEAQAWLVTQPNRGTFVADPLPLEGHEPATTGLPQAPAFDLPSRLSPLSAQDPQSLNLSDGLPDARIFPTEELARAYQRALKRHGANLLQYGEPRGHELLRQEAARWLGTRRGLAIDPGNILVTRGSRSALTLLALGLLREGDAVAVEHPGNRAAWDTLEQAGKARLLPVPVDAEGLRVDALADLLQRERIKFLLLTPQRQYPTTATLSPARRVALLDLARAHRLAVVEDDYDCEYSYGDRPQLPLISQDTEGHVVYLASLSRLIAPGLRLGLLVGPGPLVDRLAKLQRSLEWQGDRALEWAVADLIRDGVLERHLHRARKLYQERRDVLVEGLRSRFKGRLEVEVPNGGLACWVRGDEGLERWVAAARHAGLTLYSPRQFYIGEPEPFTRFGFAQASPAELASALDRLDRTTP